MKSHKIRGQPYHGGAPCQTFNINEGLGNQDQGAELAQFTDPGLVVNWPKLHMVESCRRLKSATPCHRSFCDTFAEAGGGVAAWLRMNVVGLHIYLRGLLQSGTYFVPSSRAEKN